MDPNSYHMYLARQAEHPIRLHLSQQRRDAEEAAAAQPKRQIALPVRAWLSAALIAAGERMLEKFTVKPTHADTIR